MPSTRTPKERIEQLLAEGETLARENDIAKQKAWLIAAQNIIQSVCRLEGQPYRDQANKPVNNTRTRFLLAGSVRGMRALLARLLEEIEGGFLTSVENQAIAATFDDFLDHGAEYLRRRRKIEAGVIAGIVFEDTVRRICRVLEITENGVPLETLITELTRHNVLTALKAKRARAAAGLRTSAAHARWEEFEGDDVRPVIELTRELIERATRVACSGNAAG